MNDQTKSDSVQDDLREAARIQCPKCGNGQISTLDLPCACNFCSYVMDSACPFCGEAPDWKRPWENGLRIAGCITASCWMRQAGYVTENVWNRRALPPSATAQEAVPAKFPYQRTFNAIAAAVSNQHRPLQSIGISVAAFEKEWNRQAPPPQPVSETAAQASVPDALQKFFSDWDTVMLRIGGCSDGGCMIDRPKGMHTNGGCKCWDDRTKARQYMSFTHQIFRRFRNAAAPRSTETGR